MSRAVLNEKFKAKSCPFDDLCKKRSGDCSCEVLENGCKPKFVKGGKVDQFVISRRCQMSGVDHTTLLRLHRMIKIKPWIKLKIQFRKFKTKFMTFSIAS